MSISVNGEGSATAPPDLAVMSAEVEAEAATASDAVNGVGEALRALITAAKDFGVTDEDIQTSRLSLRPIFEPRQGPSLQLFGRHSRRLGPKICGYDATESITVKTDDLARVGVLIGELVDAGLGKFSGPAYGIRRPDALRACALQAAMADAKAQAQIAAASAGVQLGDLLDATIHQTSMPPAPVPVQLAEPSNVAMAPRGAAMAPMPAPPPVRPSPLTAVARVVATFAIVLPSPDSALANQSEPKR